MSNARYLTARDLGQKILVTGILTAQSPLRLGGQDALGLADQVVLRDHEGRPYIPGASLAGVLRAALCRFLGFTDQEPPEVEKLFGCSWASEEGMQSPLIVDDAPLAADQIGAAEIRDGVCISPRTGTAETGKKFEGEFLPTGSGFHLSFELNLSGDEKKDMEIKSLFCAALSELEKGNVSLGARTSRGFGRCVAGVWNQKYFDLSTRKGLFRWLAENGGAPGNWTKAKDRSCADAAELAGVMKTEIPGKTSAPQVRVSLDLSCPGSFLLRSGGLDPDEADAATLKRTALRTGGQEEQEFALPGTSLAGCLRGRALKIANTLSDGNKKAGAFVEGLFGASPGEEKNPRASRVRVEESVLSGGTPLRHARVAIDPWRGGAREHMLLDEDALFNAKTCVRFSLSRATKEEAGLVLALVKDLFTGDLPLGGESGIGRGVFYGTSGTVHLEGMEESGTIEVSGDGKGSLEVKKGREVADSCMKAFCAELKPRGTEGEAR